MRLRMLAAIGVIAALLVAAAPAGAFILQAKPGPLSATNGIVLGPDGNFWVAEQFADSVLRMRPDGTVLNHYPLGLGAAPTTVATGPGGRVWVAATGADKLVWIDATAATPATHDVSTAGASACGPVALAAGGDGRMYFSLPFDGVCVTGSMLGSVADDGTGAITTVPGLGLVLDLAVSGGKLFAPDFDGSVVRRLALPAMTPEAVVNAPPGSQPQGVAADGAGNIWFTEFGGGAVGRFTAAAPNATVATTITPTGGALAQPAGIVAGSDGAMYVAGSGSGNVIRISADGTRFAFFPTGGAKPFRIVNGVDGDLWFTDQQTTNVLRLISGAPRTTLAGAAATSATSAAVVAGVNPRGNDTAVFFDFGTTVNYGSATTAIGVAAGLDPVSVPNALTGLAPATTYHVRARATNVDGTTVSPDMTFTTPAAPPGSPGGPGAGLPLLRAAISFGYTRTATSLTLRRVGLKKLAGGETATIRCTGSRRCPFKVRIFKRLKKGSRAFGKALLKKRRLPVGTTISVRVTKARSIGSSAVLKVRRRTGPQITRGCLVPGVAAPLKCT